MHILLDAFDLMMFKGLTMACNSKTGGHAARNNMWDSFTLVTRLLGTFDLLEFNMIWGSFVFFFKNGQQLNNH